MLRIKCFSLGDMTIEMADFEVDFCLHTERCAITRVLKSSHGSDSLMDQSKGMELRILFAARMFGTFGLCSD